MIQQIGIKTYPSVGMTTSGSYGNGSSGSKWKYILPEFEDRNK